MGLKPFQRLGQAFKALLSKPADPKKSNNYLLFGPNNAGIYVTNETALMASAFYACVDVISKAIASSDWNVYRRLPKGDHDLLFDDPLYYYLNCRPNPDMTALSFKRSLMMSALCWGNGYAEIQWTQSNTVAGLWLIHPQRVEPRRENGVLYYEVSNDDGSKVRISQDDMFHVRGPSIVGFQGDNTVIKAAKTIALAIAQERFSEAYFGNNAQLGGVVEIPTGLDDPVFERLKKEFNKKHSGTSNAFKVAFLEGGLKYHPVDVKAESTQLVEARHQQIEEMCRWFGVPPHKVQHLIRSTFNNIEHLGIEFVRDGLRPWAQEIQQEGEHKFFADRAKKFILIDLEWASQGDFLSRAQGYQIMRNIGAYSVNDILKAERRNTIGPEGDIRIVNGAAIRLEDVGKNLTPKPAPSMPESQGDVVRNAYGTLFSSIFDRINKRHKARMANLEAHAKDFAKESHEAELEIYQYIVDELRTPSENFAKLFGHNPLKDAIASARWVINGNDQNTEAINLIDKYLSQGPQGPFLFEATQ